jgi:hypothetical protein
MLLKIDIPLLASSSVSLFCLNIAEKALPISQGMEPGPISEFPDVISITRSSLGAGFFGDPVQRG